ncbi:MAG TPA: SRPBCC domain-containing protein [Pyrinomonadaceae bacterium]|jgi:hypothetical protein
MKKELYTEIEIAAAPEKIWRILTDFENYPNWNPFIRSIKGEIAAGQKLEVFIQPTGAKGMTFKPTILKAERERHLRWRGKFFVSGLFDGEHFFKIEPLGETGAKFVHGENFKGLLVGFLAKTLDTDTLRGFREMNEALKLRAENKNYAD